MRKGKSFQQMVSGKVDIRMQNNEIGLLFYFTHKNQIKMD